MSVIVAVVRPKEVRSHAIRIIAGATSKSDILEFCPAANVGAPDNDPYDLRWIILPLGNNSLASDTDAANEGDWLIRHAAGDRFSYEVLSHEAFTARYEVTGRDEITKGKTS